MGNNQSINTDQLTERIYNYLDNMLPQVSYDKWLYVGNNIKQKDFVKDFRIGAISPKTKNKKIEFENFYAKADLYIQQAYFNLTRYTETMDRNDILTFMFKSLTKKFQEVELCSGLITIYIGETNFIWRVSTDESRNFNVFRGDIHPGFVTTIDKITEEFQKRVSNFIVTKINSCFPLIVLEIGLFDSEKGGHANIILIENGSKEIRLNYYEPHGTNKYAYAFRNQIPLVIEALRIVINKQTGIRTTVNYGSCPVGLQSHLYSDPKTGQRYDIGYCQLYSLFWLYMNIYMVATIRKKQMGKGYNYSHSELTRTPIQYLGDKTSASEFFLTLHKDKRALYNMVVRFAYFLIGEYLKQNIIPPAKVTTIFQINWNANMWTEMIKLGRVKEEKKVMTAQQIYDMIQRGYLPEEKEKKLHEIASNLGIKGKKVPETYEEYTEKKEKLQKQKETALIKKRKKKLESGGGGKLIKAIRKIGQPCDKGNQCISQKCAYDQNSHIREWEREQQFYTQVKGAPLSKEELTELKRIWNAKDQKYCIVR